MARKCMFCDGSPCNREHLFSEWIRDLLPNDGTLNRSTFSAIDSEWGTTWDESAPVNITVKWVDDPCNSGWMNDIENAARPTMTEMIEGRSVGLTPTDQLAVARWGFLKTIVGERMKADHPRMPAELVQAFYERQELPPHTFVRLGRYSGPKNAHYSHSTGHLAPSFDDAGHTYSSVLAVRQFVIHLIGFALVQEIEVADPPPDPAFLRIYPSDQEVAWPPGVSLMDDTLDGLTVASMRSLRFSREMYLTVMPAS